MARTTSTSSDPAAVEKSARISEKQIDKEEPAIDALLDGDDTLFNKLDC